MSHHLRAAVGVGLLVLLVASGAGVAAQDAASRTVVPLAPAGPTGLQGLAILTATGEQTAVQVQVVEPPANTSAAIHPGSCEAPDPTPVALLGELSSGDLVTITVPLPLAAIADGAHAIAVHPGLDLATVLACGDIPLVAGPGPMATEPPPATAPRSRFEGTRYGWTFAWSAPWEEVDLGIDPAVESVSVDNGTSTVTLAAFDQEGGDALACLRDWEGRLLAGLREGQIDQLAPVTDADGSILWSGDAEVARGAYAYRQADAPGDPLRTEDVECVRLSDSAVLQILHAAPSASYRAEAALVDALIGGLETGRPSATDGPTVTAAPTGAPATPALPTAPPATPEPVVTPAPTPEPTPGPDCAGMSAWTTATLARFDRLKEIGDEVNRSANAGMQVYAQALASAAEQVWTLRSEQAREATPEALARVQGDLDDFYGALLEAYDILSQAYATVDTSLAQQGFSKASEAEAILKEVRTEAREIVEPCGIRIPLT